jgi:hypothetical protein
MRIANPIYDVVFKYLMEDAESAKLLLSEILQEEIVELAVLPQETTFQIDENEFTKLPKSVQEELNKDGKLNVYLQRMDFTANIKTPSGKLKKVIIEVQKARYWAQIQRFRRYLGNAYLRQDADGEHRPIIAIYFLGDTLKSIKTPVIRVKNRLVDAFLGTEVQLPKEKEEEFIDLLMHEGVIVQIPYLENNHRCKLEEFLSVFEQKRVLQEDKRFLEFDTEAYPEQFRAVLRRLAHAVCDTQVQRNMTLEDEVQGVFATLDKKLEENYQALAEKDQALEEKDRALEKKDKMIINCVLAVHCSGESVEQIMEKTGLSHDEIQEIIKQEI